MSISRKATACLATILVALFAPAAHANSYTIEDLGIEAEPLGINGSGLVVGTRHNRAIGFRSGHWHVLDERDQEGAAVAINAHGDAVGGQEGFRSSTPILWSRNRYRHVLALPGDSTSGSATAISSDGTVVGVYDPVDGPFEERCFRTLADGSSIDLGLLAAGNRCVPFGIDDEGEIIGDANVVPEGPRHAFLWRIGALQDLGTLGTGDTSLASGINGRGQVVGASTFEPRSDFHAFSWRQGVMKDIGDSPDYAGTFADAINDRGEIVGSGNRAVDGALRALRFADGAVVALEDEVPDLDDWELWEANAIDPHGVIVGRGFRHGDVRQHGFLLRPVP